MVCRRGGGGLFQIQRVGVHQEGQEQRKLIWMWKYGTQFQQVYLQGQKNGGSHPTPEPIAMAVASTDGDIRSYFTFTLLEESEPTQSEDIRESEVTLTLTISIFIFYSNKIYLD